MARPVRPKLKFFKLHNMVKLPAFGTQGAACFDLSYQPYHTKVVNGYNPQNSPTTRELGKTGDVAIMPGDRLLVPTGLIMDIPQGYSVRFHIRSSMALKSGIALANAEAVIDWDYIDELFVLLTNIGVSPYIIKVGDRIAQAELVKMLDYTLDEVTEKPTKKTDRNGGYGSTGRGN